MGKFQFQFQFQFQSSILGVLVLWPLVLGFLSKLATVPVAAEADPFGYFRLALQWPPSVWTRTGVPPERFTIHGLWPDNYSGPYLRNCTTQQFVAFTNQTLVGLLNQNWPNLKSGTNVRFWAYEWGAHGTCARGYNQTQYFTLALELLGRYNLTHGLNQSGIVPSNTVTYPVQNISTAVIALTTKTPDLMCYSSKLQEIRICFNPASPNAVIDCPQYHSSTTCSGNVKFPAS